MDSEIVESILRERYYQPGETCWEDIARRVANFIGDNEQERDDFFEIINTKKFIPNSPALMNAGTGNPMLFACYALGPDDSIDSIFETMKVAAKIMKLGGGIGIDWSHLRPEGALVKSTNGTSSGVIAFMRNFNEVIETVKSGGRRRGAGISLLDINHGDAEKFITCKNIEGTFSNFNISVRLTDNFMNNLNDPENAKKFDLIANAMWTRSEPGICYIDTTKNALVVPLESDEDIGFNPCGEQPLVYNWKKTAGECCNLGSLNIPAFWDYASQTINYSLLDKCVRIAVRYLDNSIDKSIYPTSEIERMSKDTRKIGLGEMGWADLFILMGIRYGSQDSLNVISEIKSFIQKVASDESETLAYEKGAFPKCGNTRLMKPMRNAALTTEAPTGSLSLFAGISSGIEPVFSYVVDRRNACGEGSRIIHELFYKHLSERYLLDDIHKIVDWMYTKGTIQSCPYVDQSIKNVFVTAMDITPREHINVQAEFQKYTSASISKTLNLPESTTVDTIKELIVYGWKQGLKGLTIYRHNSRNEVVYDIKKASIANSNEVIEFTNPVKYKLATANGRILPKTPRIMASTTSKIQSGCGKLLITIAEAFGKPHTVTVQNLGGGCESLQRGLVKMTALALRWDVPVFDIVKVLKSERCNVALKNPNSECLSCTHALGKMIEAVCPDSDLDIPPKYDQECNVPSINHTHNKILCPSCGEPLIMESGCQTCHSCGYSRCN